MKIKSNSGQTDNDLLLSGYACVCKIMCHASKQKKSYIIRSLSILAADIIIEIPEHVCVSTMECVSE